MASNVDGTNRGYDADNASNMAAYDQLPKAVRRALANSDHNWSARQCLRALRGKGRDARGAKAKGANTAKGLAAFIQQNDASKHARDAAEGIVAP